MYKNYLVIEKKKAGDEWTVATFNNESSAIDFCNAYTPQAADLVEVWGTDEDPDTFLTADTVYIKDVKTGETFRPAEADNYVKNLASRLYDEEGGETVEEITADLMTLKGCYTTINYLLHTIDDILDN